jgi:phosphoglucomutase/phosphomannomutase
VLEQRKAAGTISPGHYLVKTLVTTEMIRRIGDSYGVKTYGDLLVGFKWIAGVMDDVGPENFLLGAEESHGYLVGQYARDKDGAVAAMLMAELAARLKADGQTLHDKMDALFWQHGYHAERLLNLKMEGSEGMSRMEALMGSFRADPPTALAGLSVTRVRDYLNGTSTAPGNAAEPLEGPKGDLVMLDLAEPGNFVAVRPSGTEPKVKFYMFTYVAPEMLADLGLSKEEMTERLSSLENDLKLFADRV